MATYYDAAPHGGTTRGEVTLANWAGAAVSLALVIGVASWGYQLMVRDVSTIPVIRAAEGPMRIAPADPGGRPADNQGLAVNNVAATERSAPLADRLVLAPGDATLTDEDMPMGILPDTVGAVPEASPSETLQQTTPDSAAGSDGVVAVVEVPEDDPLMQLANQIAAGVQPLEPLAPLPEPIEDVTASGTAAPAFRGGLRRSLIPVPRPADLVVRVAATDTPATGTIQSLSAAVEVDPASIAKGTSLVQLGAYDSRDVAVQEWDRISGNFTGFFDGKSRVVQKATAGGREFYRLRVVGFDGMSDARRFCSALLAGRAECIPVSAR